MWSEILGILEIIKNSVKKGFLTKTGCMILTKDKL